MSLNLTLYVNWHISNILEDLHGVSIFTVVNTFYGISRILGTPFQYYNHI